MTARFCLACNRAQTRTFCAACQLTAGWALAGIMLAVLIAVTAPGCGSIELSPIGDAASLSADKPTDAGTEQPDTHREVKASAADGSSLPETAKLDACASACALWCHTHADGDSQGCACLTCP